MATRHNSVSLTATVILLFSTGCAHQKCDGPGCYEPTPLGTISDPVWQQQEANAEASDFVVHEHEFVANTIRLNHAGEQHVVRIAARAAETPFPVLVEPSSMSSREGDRYGFPIHGNRELDNRRRELIVKTLSDMGVVDADKRVVTSPALTPGFQQFEAERAYYNGFSNSSNNAFGGFGGLGGVGGFGAF